ncbi:Ubiquitin-activating enzyme E1-like [Erysiphe neolycopersici]|uniref:Ubiquitin-activating enzyme E1-like n=1 Tax=Erysiphe neolycopersici TaxID=212602 RepID=A0A420HWF0_9PEZI|nr:Ubiquitin-activating enzyme E1-like [Erysiphe neolycopersici]
MTRDHYNKQSHGFSLNRLVKEVRRGQLGVQENYRRLETNIFSERHNRNDSSARHRNINSLIGCEVGAGGIGCELLKNLVLSGFGEIHIVDLDTIDLSNLNRQFLFRQEHIKKSKATVAKDAAQKFNPNVKLEAYMANITDAKFNLLWFRGFTLVFNALDNLQARRHVNKMCIAADIPLIESGTTGFNGQVQVIKKGLTACYDCTPKEMPKSFPTCTIRSTPSQPIHCIVWAKSYLLNEIFGMSEENSPNVDHSEDAENADEIANLKKETEALRKIRDAMGSDNFPQLLFNKAYRDDIERLRSMDGLWKNRRAPESLDYMSIHARAIEANNYSIDQVLKDVQRIWNIEENLIVFVDSLERLSKRTFEMRSSTSQAHAEPPIIVFDKDDEDTLDFVTASANLRSSVFGIENKSKFDVKQMAGNIIPAIATTNAIVAGLCVLQSFKVLEGNFSGTKEVFLSPFATDRLLASDRYQNPNPECPVCSVAHNRILIDVQNTTLRELVEDFLKLGLGYGEEITINDGHDHLLYDIDETINLDKKLSDLGIKNDSFLTIVDDNDDHENGPRVNLILTVNELTATDGQRIKSLDIPLQSQSEKVPLSPLIPRRKPLSTTPDYDVEQKFKSTDSSSLKRPHSPEIPNGSCKKFKPEILKKDSGSIEIDDSHDGIIMID